MVRVKDVGQHEGIQLAVHTIVKSLPPITRTRQLDPKRTTSKDPTEGLRCFRQLLSDETQEVRQTAAKSKIAWEALLKQHPKEGLGRLGAWISASSRFWSVKVWFGLFSERLEGDIIGSDEGRLIPPGFFKHIFLRMMKQMRA